MFRAHVVLKRPGFTLDASLETGPGVTVLFGPSGSGKSTFLSAVAGLAEPAEGEVVREGEILFRRGREGPPVNLPARKRRMGYVFQSYALFPHLSALANVAYPLRGVPDARQRSRRLLARMGLEGLGHRYPAELSGGQRQRVAVARALAVEPRTLLLDEPFAALDLHVRRRLRREIRSVLEELEIPVLLITHDREEALALGDRVVVLDDGRVTAEGMPVEVLGRPRTEGVARLTGVENLLPLAVEEVLAEEGLVRCGRGDFSLEVPLAEVEVRATLSVGIRASDILLASVRPSGISAQNVLSARVVSVRREGAMVEVGLESAEIPLVGHVTPRAARELQLAPGAQVWAVIKATSCLVMNDGPSDGGLPQRRAARSHVASPK